MTLPQIEIQIVAVVVSVACALPGVFLILRRMAMMSDAISHAILPGIVVGFFITESLGSPFLIVAAALTGLLTVSLVEAIERTDLVKEDAAIGIVFPILFSIGIILIAHYAGDVHLDTDAVLLGELAFAPFDRLTAFGWDLGPRSLWTMGSVLVLNAVFLTLFYKELKLATFDAGLAATLGFLPGVLHYALMGLVSLTAVTAFDAVGSILVVALMIGPPATAYLLTDSLAVMLGLSAGIGAACAVGGYWLAHAFDVSIAGSMATATGLVFGAAVLFAPDRGVVAQLRRSRDQKRRFAEELLAIHLLQHEGTASADRESRVQHLQEHFNWDADFADRTVRRAARHGTVRRRNGHLVLTESGRSLAQQALERT